jgi:peroxiredoxin
MKQISFLLCSLFLLMSSCKKEEGPLPDVTDPAPEIALPNPDGTVLKLSDLKGKVVVLHFWASWCPFCRQDNPALVALYNKYKDQGLEVYSVSLDTDKSKWKDAIQTQGLAWKNHVSDLKKWDSAAVETYKVDKTPYMFLIDKQGVIQVSNFKSNLESEVEKLLK